MNSDKLNVEFNSENRIIIAKTRQDLDGEYMKNGFLKIMKISRDENCYKVLIDGANTRKMPSGTELFFIGLFIAKSVKILSKFRIALVVSDTITNDFRFFDNILANRMIDLHPFKNLNEAEKWLLQKNTYTNNEKVIY